MDQELKQRLIGAAVITALAAIFVPMLFDDPIDETGKHINELKIPEIPAKVQDVEIMPLPEKVEDVATEAPIDKPLKPQSAPAFVEEGGNDEAALEAPRPKIKLSAKEAAVSPRQAQVIQPDIEAAEAEDVAVQTEVVKTIDKAPKATSSQAQTLPVVPPTPIKVPKPVVKAPENKPELVAEVPVKPSNPATSETATTRWYLNAGSFSQKANAVTLQENLKQQGFAATLKEVATGGGTVYKVRVGPMLDKAKAQAVKAKLAQINVNSFVSGDE